MDAPDRPSPNDTTGVNAAVGWSSYDGCFGCGAANPVGLHLCGAIAHDGPYAGRYVMPVRLSANYQGGRGVIHGGIQAVVLDEAFGQAIHVLGPVDGPIVTALFELRYRRPAPTAVDLVAVASIDDRRGSWFTVSGFVADTAGMVLTEASARWRLVP